MKTKSLLFQIIISLIIVGCGIEKVSPTPSLPPDLQKGKELFSKYCASCHATDPDLTIVGPSLAGIANRAEYQMEGLDAQQYIEDSILYPADFIVEGYEDLMPKTFGKNLTREEINLLVEYVLTFK